MTKEVFLVMKKLGYALLCSAMVFGITACGSSDTSSKEDSADEEEVEEQETKSEYGVNETSDVDGVKVHGYWCRKKRRF